MCSVNLFVNLGRVPPIFNEEIISEYKEDEIEDIGFTNFSFMEEISGDS